MTGSILVLPLPPGISWTYILSPLGPVGLAATRKGVFRVVLEAPPRWAEKAFPHEALSHLFPHGFPGGKALTAYLNGYRAPLHEVPVDLAGTDFQMRVWEAARRIPHGEVRTYGGLARAIGHPGAARAVGGALGANPVPLLVPCHRVVAADGRLGGFTGGTDLKRRLLALEGVRLRDSGG